MIKIMNMILTEGRGKSTSETRAPLKWASKQQLGNYLATMKQSPRISQQHILVNILKQPHNHWQHLGNWYPHVKNTQNILATAKQLLGNHPQHTSNCLRTSRVTRVTLVLWIGNEALRELLTLWERIWACRLSEALIESHQFIGWWRNAAPDALTSSAYTGERAIYSSDLSAEKNPVGSVRSLAANAASRPLFREQGLRE